MDVMLSLIVVILVIVFLGYLLLSWKPSSTYLREVVFKKVYAYLLNRFLHKYNRALGSYKEQLFRSMSESKTENNLKGFVLEIGVGGGANLAFYPAGTQLVALEPNEYFKSYLTKNIEKYPGISLHEFIVGKAENMDTIPDNSISSVVSTVVLCSVKDIDKVLGEIRRVLKPGGRFYFLEHTASLDKRSWVFWIQQRIQPFWAVMSDGCSITSKTWENIENAGFSQVEIKKFVAPLSRLMFVLRPHIVGYAVK